jgi:hypothetical protein
MGHESHRNVEDGLGRLSLSSGDSSSFLRVHYQRYNNLPWKWIMAS